MKELGKEKKYDMVGLATVTSGRKSWARGESEGGVSE